MYIKFLKHGKGDPAKAAAYLIDDVDHLNVPRSDVQVLRGDPQTFTALAQSITNKWLYTSGVIAWSKDDAPSNAEIEEVLDSFEKHAFAGLQPNQYHFTAVLHEEDDGSKHVHFLVPRLEIETGKALNIAPPGNQKYFDPLRDYFNYSKGWSRPDAPALQQDSQVPDHVHYQDRSAVKAGLKDKTRTEINEFIGAMIEQRIQGGYINDRADVLNAILDYGIITRISDKYIAFQPHESEKITRLKGAFYESEFSIESYLKVRSGSEIDATASSEYRTISAEHREHAQRCRTELIQLAEKRSTYNRNRYTAGITSTAEFELSQVSEQQLNQLDRGTDQRNSYAFESTSTAAATGKSAVSADQRAVTAVERYEPRDWRDSQNQKNTSNINHSPISNTGNLADLNSDDELRDQNQNHSDSSSQKRTINRESETGRSPTGFNFEQNRTVQKIPSNFVQGLADHDNRKTAFESHFRTTTAIRNVIESIEAAGFNDLRIREIHAKSSELQQYVDREKQRARETRFKVEEPTAFREFAIRATEQLKTTITEPFTAVNQQLEHRSASQNTDSAYSAESGATRNIDTDRAVGGENNRENALSRAVSTKISSFDSTNIITALEKIEKTREMRRENERKNDRGYDSPSPF
jgi:hypothetical protein